MASAPKLILKAPTLRKRKSAVGLESEGYHSLPTWVYNASDLTTPSSPAVRKTQTALLTIAAVADQLMLSTRTVRRMIARGQLKAVRLGRSVRIAPSAIEMILDQSEINTFSFLRDYRE